MNRFFLFLLAILLGALPLQSQDLLVQGGKLFTGTGEETVPNPGVYVRNGRIMSVGNLPGELPPSVQTLQLSEEEVLLPGLIDLHAHYRVVMEGMVGDDTAATPKVFLANGVTATFPAGEVEPHKMRELSRLIDAGKRDGPRLLNSGPYYGSAAPDWSRDLDAGDIRERVDTWAARGASGFKAKGITAPHLETLIERAHRHGLTVTAHLGSGSGSSVNPAEAVRMGIDRVEHFLGGPCLPDTASAYASLRGLDGSESCVGEVIDLYTQHGVWFDATLSTYGIIGRVDHPAYRYWTDEMRYLSPWMRKAFESDPDHSLEELFREVYHAKKAILKRYYEAGGRITLGTDRPVMKSTLPFLGGFAAHREMQAMTLAGIPNHAVLKIATINGARAIGMGDRLGTIEEGKYADFFVAGGDPLEDITHTRDVRAVVKGGLVYDPGSLLKAAEGRLGPTYDLAIHHANIIDVETGEVMRDRSLSVHDGTIRAIGPAGSTPAAADTLDAGGGYLMPGLWDMHVHFRGGDSLAASNRELLKLYLANGITSVRDAGGDITPYVLEWDALVRAGSLEGPRIYTSGPKLDGPDARWDGSIELDTPRQVPAALDSLQAIGSDYVKIYDSTISPEVYRAILEGTEERGMKVSGHMPFSVDFRKAVRMGLDATEHMYYAYKAASPEANALTARMNGGDPLGFYEVLERVMETYDPETARKTFEIMAEESTAVVPTLHISEVLDHLHEVDHSGDAYLDYIDPGIQRTYQGRLRGAQNRSEEAVQFQLEMNEGFGGMIRPMYEAGVRILAGSDAGPYNSFVYPGISLHRELQQLVENGLPPLAALQAATIYGARWMEVDDRFGRVAPGYAADLLILGANPLEDIANTRDIAWVVQQGEVHSRTELDILLESTRNE